MAEVGGGIVSATTLNVTVIGTGAMGSLFGARLSRHARVTMLGGWQEQIDAIRRDGLIVETPEGEERVRLAATTELREVPPADLALVLVKSPQTPRAARLLPRLLRKRGVALTLQNGLGNLEQLEAAAGSERALLGVTTQGGTVVAPGRVREGGKGTTTLGWKAQLTHWIEEIGDLFERAGFATQVSDDLDAVLWAKLAVNCAINPATALLRIPNGALLHNPYALALAESAGREAAAVARARGIALPFEDAAERVRAVAQATARNYSSMLQDVMRGAPTEIDAINGAVVREGERLGVPTPVNATLWRLIKAREG
jgi:2-dehydropantoate 2-reductase